MQFRYTICISTWVVIFVVQVKCFGTYRYIASIVVITASFWRMCCSVVRCPALFLCRLLSPGKLILVSGRGIICRSINRSVAVWQAAGCVHGFPHLWLWRWFSWFPMAFLRHHYRCYVYDHSCVLVLALVQVEIEIEAQAWFGSILWGNSCNLWPEIKRKQSVKLTYCKAIISNRISMADKPHKFRAPQLCVPCNQTHGSTVDIYCLK